MWTLLIGHPPFVDPGKPPADMYAFRDRVLHDPLPAMTRDDVPGWLVVELAKAMAKLPAHRHASAADFAQSVRRGSLGLGPAAVDLTATAARGTVHISGLPPKAWPIAAPPEVPIPVPAPVPVPGKPEAAGGAGPRPPVAGAPPHPTSSAPGWVGATAPPGTGGAGVYVPPARQDANAGTPSESGVGAWPPPPSALPDEGGWLGPPMVDFPPPPDEFEIARQHASARRFAGDLRPTSARRNGLAVILITLAVLGVAAGSALVLASRSPKPPVASSSAVPTNAITTVPAGAPTNVGLTDNATSVTLTWADPTGGTVQFLVAGTGPNGEKLKAQNVPAGLTTATFSRLDPSKHYCFVVAAVYNVNRVPPAAPVCTGTRPVITKAASTPST